MAIAIEDLPVAPPTRITFAVPATDPILLVHEEVLPDALEALVAVPQVHLPGVPLKLGSLTAPVAPILWEIPCFWRCFNGGVWRKSKIIHQKMVDFPAMFDVHDFHGDFKHRPWLRGAGPVAGECPFG